MSRCQLHAIALIMVSASLLPAEDDKKPTEDKPTEKITYADHVLPIFRARCGSCHNANDRRGGLVLDTYAGIMEGGSSGEVIDPGDAGLSYLWLLINHEDEPKMPPNADKLPEAELAVIKKWIDLGALENSGSTARIKKKPTLAKVEVTGARPAEVAMPGTYLGDPEIVTPTRNAVTALATSPWAPLVAVSGHRQVAVYNSQTLEVLGVLPYPEGQPRTLKFSRDGSLLLVGGGRGGASGNVVVFDVKSGERKAEVGEEYDEVLGADISPDQAQIALGGPKKMLRVYSTESGELQFEDKKHTDWITALAFSPDGVLLASGDRANGLVVWEAHTGRIFYDLAGHQGAITAISWRPDSNVVASASADGTIKLWNMENGGLIKSWNAHGGGVTAMTYTRDGELVSTGRDRVTRLWRGDGEKIRDFPALADLGMAVAHDAESKRVLAGDWTGIVAIWNAEDASALGQIDTNPPTLAMQITGLDGQRAALLAQAQARTNAAADVKKRIAERQAAADQAVVALNQVNEKAKQASTARQTADKALGEKQAALAVAEAAVKQAEESVTKAKSGKQQAAENLANAQKAVEQTQAQFNSVQQSVKAALAAVTQAKSAATAAAAAAEPTAEEKLVLETDEGIKQVVAGRRAVADAAAAALKQAEEYGKQVQTKLQEVEKQLTDQKAALAAATTAAKAADEALVKAEAAATQAVQKLAVGQKEVEQAQSAATLAAQAEKAAADAATAAKAAADKAIAEAQPTEEEQKAIQTAEAEAKAAQDQAAALEQRLNRLKEIQSQLAAATTSN